MDKVYDFSPISGVTASNNGHTILLHADTSILAKIKEKLKVFNKGISYDLKLAKDRLKRFEKSVRCNPNKIEECRQHIENLEDQLWTEYYEDVDLKTIEVPKGFWWFANSNISKTNLSFVDFPKSDIKPRQYQNEAVEALIKNNRAMVELATGLGKTVVLTHLVHVLKKNRGPDFRVMVVVPTVELMRQTLDFIKKFYPNACGVGGKNKFKNGCDILVGVVNSCVQYADRFQAIIIDEVHHSSSKMYTELVVRASKADYVYGMTATPTRADGMIMGVHANCGPIVYRRDTQWGVQNGYLCESKFFMMYFPTKHRMFDSIQETKAYKKIVEDNPTLIRELVKILSHMLNHGRKVLFLTKNVKPSQRLAEQLSAILGIEINVAHGEYRKPLNDFREGKTNLLIANDALCGEGVDIPGVDCMINLTQRSSESKVRQILGRGLRVSKNKDCLYFFDLVLSGYGRYNDDKVWRDVYVGSSYRRKRIYNEIGHVNEVHVKESW